MKRNDQRTFHRRVLLALIVCLVLCAPAAVQVPKSFAIDDVELVPLPQHQVSFRVDGKERLRWHFGPQYPRPFFYPFLSPTGAALTRMGHPGASNHDHHRSIWFGHQKVNGVDFWSDNTDARIRQNFWYAYKDGGREAVMASQLGWYNGDGQELMQQDLVAALITLGERGHALEIQITMRPGEGAESAQLGKTNFGFLAVRVAKSLSVHFGGGQIGDSSKREGEQAIFGERARWVDYTGIARQPPVALTQQLSPIMAGLQPRPSLFASVGITYHDHPDNPRYPTRWHVREDGWMGASFNMREAYAISAEKPLTLRYLLHAHSDMYNSKTAQAVHAAFAKRPGFRIVKSTKKHRQYEVTRIESP